MQKEMSGKGTEHVRAFELLDDGPSAIDEIGTHKNIAHSIHEIISKSKEGRAIELVGARGSGKSTVIRQLEAINNASKNKINIFIFDAWVHENDNLRRAFLEELISYRFKKNDDMSKKEKAECDKSIEKYKTKISTRKISKYINFTSSGLIVAVLASVPLIGMALIEAAPKHPYWRVIGFILTVLPGIGLTLLFLCKKNANKFLNADETTAENSMNSSIEFGNIYKEIINMKDGRRDQPGQSNDSIQKELIVFDNLDRLQPEKAKEMLNLMNIFLYKNFKSNDCKDNVWILIANNGKNRKINNGINMKIDNEGNQGVEDLYDKFNIKFFVPNILDSDWYEYTKRKLSELFRWDDLDVEAAIKIFSLKNSLGAELFIRPTIRETKHFINQIISFYSSSEYATPFNLAFVAAYADANWYPPTNYVELQNNFNKTCSDMINMAALYYRKTPEEALQIMIDLAMAPILLKADNGLLKQLINLQYDDAIQICMNQYLRNHEIEIKSNPVQIAKIALGVNDLNNKFFDDFMDNITEIASKISSWKTHLRKDSCKGIALLANKNDELARQIIDRLQQEYKDAAIIDDEVSGMVIFINSLQNEEIKKGFKICNNFDEYFRLLQSPSGLEPSEYINIRPGITINIYRSEILKKIESGVDDSFIKTFEKILNVDYEFPKESVASKISTILTDNKFEIKYQQSLIKLVVAIVKYDKSMALACLNGVGQSIYRFYNGATDEVLASWIVAILISLNISTLVNRNDNELYRGREEFLRIMKDGNSKSYAMARDIIKSSNGCKNLIELNRHGGDYRLVKPIVE